MKSCIPYRSVSLSMTLSDLERRDDRILVARTTSNDDIWHVRPLRRGVFSAVIHACHPQQSAGSLQSQFNQRGSLTIRLYRLTIERPKIPIYGRGVFLWSNLPPQVKGRLTRANNNCWDHQHTVQFHPRSQVAWQNTVVLRHTT